MDWITNVVSPYLAGFAGNQMAFVSLVGVSIFVFSLGISFVVLGATNPLRRRVDQIFREEKKSNDELDGRILVKISTMVGHIIASINHMDTMYQRIFLPVTKYLQRDLRKSNTK